MTITYSEYIKNKDKYKPTKKTTTNKKTNKEEKKWYEEYINLDRIKEIDSFKDYYDFQINTSNDLLGNAFQGVFQGAEGLSDFARNRYADLADRYAKGADFIGWDTASSKLTESANKARENALVNDTQDMIDSWEHIISGDLAGKKKTEDLTAYEDIHKNSALGNSGREMTQSIALNTTNAALSAASGGSLGIPLIAASAAGNAEQEALQNGATIDEARTYGILMGGIEAGTEMLAGGLGKISEGLGFGKGVLDDQLVKALTKKMKSTALKNITTFAIKSVGEGTEEVLAGLGGAIAQKLTYMKEEDLKELIKNQDLMKAFLMGTLSSVIMQGPSTVTSTVQGRDVNTGLTQVQQEYVNEIAEQRLVEAQKRNAKLNGYQQMKIEDRALEDFQKGRLFDGSKLPLSDDVKTMDLQQSAYKHGINPNSEAVVNIKSLLDNRDIKGRFDAAIFEQKGIDGNAFWTNNDGTREVVFNPNASADVILEELAIHELTHDLMSSSNSKSTIDSQNIMDYVSSLEGYEEARQRVEEKYKQQTKGMPKAKAEAYIDEEIVADTLGKNIGSQEYIRKLVDSEPKLSKIIYNWVVDTVNNLANKNGVKNEKLYWENVKNSFENAYNMEYVSENNESSAKLSIQKDKNGRKYVNIDTDQSIFEGLEEKDYNKIAKMYINEYLKGETTLAENDVAIIDSTTAKKYTNPGKKQPNFDKKMRLSTELKNVLEISEKIDSSLPIKSNSKYGKWEYYKIQFKLGNQTFEGIVNIGVDSNNNKHLYEVNNIKKTSGISETSPNRPTGFSENNVSQSNDNVKYSLIGEKGANKASKVNSNNKFLVDSLEKAKQLRKQRFTNEEIRQKTMWFQDPNGKWLFEIADSDAKLTKLEKNKTYKLSEVLKHDDLFEVYPELGNIKVKTRDVKGNNGDKYSGYYDVLTKTIVLNNELLTPNRAEYMRGTLLHEVQHRIQVIEGLEMGNTGKNHIQYFSSLGEIESSDVEARKNMSYKELLANAPEVSKQYPIHPMIKEIHDNPNSKTSQKLMNNPEVAELYNEIYNKGNKGEYNRVEINQKGTTKTTQSEKAILRDIRRWADNLRNNKSLQKELDNSSFSFKEKQLEIIQSSNPVEDDYHTWIRNVDDIKTLEEALKDGDWADYDEFNPDLARQDIEDAINTGEITVYSSYPIEQGIFVSPSKMEAESYSGDGKVYSKKVNIDDVAWIDPTQGQYASVKSNDVRYSLSDNEGKRLTKEQQNYFKDSKVRDENGRLLVMYRGDTGETINIFDKNKSRKSNLYGTGFYFADENMAGIYGDTTPYYLNIVNPLYVNKDTHNITKEQYSKFIKLAIENEDYSFENYGNISTDELINKLYDGRSDFKLINDVVATAMGDYRDAFEIFEKANGIKYDGIISNSQTVVYDSNQIKNIDNTNPTNNPDIRKSQQNERWQSFLDNNFKSHGTKTRLGDIKLPGLQNAIQEEVQNQTQQALLPIANELKELNKNLNKVMNPTEIAQLTPQDANTTPNLPGINRNKVGDGKSKFFDNINNKVNMLSDEQKTPILNEEDVKYYDKITNKDSLDEAFARLQENGANESLRWFNNKSENATATDVAEGWILLKQYADSGNTEGMVEVAKKMREIGSKAGQTVQAFNILSRLTPEGMVKYAQSELLEAYDQMVKGKSAKWIEENRSKFDLQPSEVQFIMDTMKEVSTMEDGYDKRFKLAQIQKIMTDKLPPSKGAGIKAWMRISMLFNPKTQVRNVAGNAIIAPINAFGDLFASGADKLISKKTGVRTTGTTNLKNYMSGAKQGLYQSYNDFKHGVNTRNIQGNRFEITEGRSFDNNKMIGKALNKVDSILSLMLDAGDRAFYEASFVNSINNQLVLNNTTEVTDTMIDIATQEALSRTWQDNNRYTKFVLSIRNQLNQVNIGGYGLGDVLIPFAKTPANLTKAIIDYSPVGLVNTINKGFQLNRSLTNGQYTAQMQHDFVQSLGKTVAGTALYVLGYALAKTGVTTGESDEDKDVSNFMKNTMGVNSYSIKIGDKTFTYDWAQPLAAPLSITANLVQKQKEEASLLENITSTLDTAGNLLLEQSFMESINTVLNNNEGIATGIQEAILDLPSRAIPTFFKQIVDLTDGTQRQTFVKGKPIQSAVNSVIAKIPGLSYTLDPSVDTLGRDIEKYGGKNNLFNVFLNPANVNTENISESAQEIYDVYKQTGESGVMPRVAPYTITIDGEKINLSSSDRTEYQRISGKIIEDNVQNLMNTSSYTSMSDTEKAEVIKNIVNYSYNVAQKELFGKELSDSYENAYEYSQIGDVSDYYTFKESIDDTNADTKRISIRDYLVDSYLNDEQIAYLYGAYYSSENELNYVRNAKISMKEFIKFDSEEFTSDYNSKGNAITNSRRNKMISFVNGLNLSLAQKAMLIKTEYSSYDRYDSQIFNYVNGLQDTAYNKMVLLKKAGFDDYDNEIIEHVNSQNISKAEKEKILKDMGFKVRNGRVYS